MRLRMEKQIDDARIGGSFFESIPPLLGGIAPQTKKKNNAMKTLVLAFAAIMLGISASVADHISIEVRVRGVAEDDFGTFRITESYFVGPGNYLVADFDAIPSLEDFDLEEWSDTNLDGIPDTFVASLYSETHMASLENRKFSANLTDDALGESALSLLGRVKVNNDLDQVGVQAKVQGVLIDDEIDGGLETIFKGHLKSRGPVLVD